MERQLEHLVRGLLAAGRPVTVIARTCAVDPREGLRFVRVPGPRRPFTTAYPAFFVLASTLAARRRGALVHTTGAVIANPVDLSTVHYCHRAAARTLTTPRARRAGRAYALNAAISARLSRAGEWWAYRPARARVLCAVSGGLASELRSAFPAMASRVRAIPNGVDTAQFRPDQQARRRVRARLGVAAEVRLALFVGGDWERKGLRHVLDALTQAPGWQLAVAGDGDAEALLTWARRIGIAERLHVLGPSGDLPPLYAAADAFVLPTAYETFSLVTYEAAASGLPLLVTRVHGVEDVLEHGRNGWFVTPDGREIAGRLRELQADPALAGRMGDAARAAAAAFSWEAMVERYLQLYDELDA
jgi:UDP-glucose:(heptosyl)LPS alpha-1,3-glucosyltransferase